MSSPLPARDAARCDGARLTELCSADRRCHAPPANVSCVRAESQDLPSARRHNTRVTQGNITMEIRQSLRDG